IEGFNAARSDRVSVESLNRDTQAADEIDGDHAFRIVEGYDAIPLALLHAIPHSSEFLQLHAIAESVAWRKGSVEVVFRSALSGERNRLRCKRLLITAS